MKTEPVEPTGIVTVESTVTVKFDDGCTLQQVIRAINQATVNGGTCYVVGQDTKQKVQWEVRWANT